MAGDGAAPQITSRTAEPRSMPGASDADAPRAGEQARTCDQAAFVGLHAHRRYMAASGLLEADVEGLRVLFSIRTGRDPDRA